MNVLVIQSLHVTRFLLNSDLVLKVLDKVIQSSQLVPCMDTLCSRDKLRVTSGLDPPLDEWTSGLDFDSTGSVQLLKVTLMSEP